jgi:hypothetical protein
MKTMTPQIARSTCSMADAARVRAETGQRVLRLHGGYVVLDPAAGEPGSAALERLAAQWRGYHITVVLDAPRDPAEWVETELGRAVQTFDRVVLCDCDEGVASEGGMAAGHERAVRRFSRVQCQLIADTRRALRHCIDGMIPGDVIAYCCNAQTSALEILEEYGATPLDDMEDVQRAGASAGTPVAPNGTAGASAYSQRL